MIEIKNLTKGYEEKREVLKNVNLKIEDSCVFGLVGINGAGKSTLLRLIAGVLRADAGQVCVDNENVWENERKKAEIFFLPDDPFYASGVTARSLADMYRAVYDFNEETFQSYLKKFKLNEKSPIRNFSKGMKRQVFVSLALAIAPKYLLLDEAFDGLDPLARLVFKRGLVELVEEKGSTVILDHGTITCAGELEQDLGRVHKFQAAFEREVSPEMLGFSCMSFHKTGRVVQILARGNAEELTAKLKTLDPLFVEEIEVDFEELFIGEVEARGYLQ